MQKAPIGTLRHVPRHRPIAVPHHLHDVRVLVAQRRARVGLGLRARRSPDHREIRRLARESLKYPYVELTGLQALSVGKGFANELRQYGGALHACTILENHFHVVTPRHRYDVRRFAGRLKGAATKQLRADGIHPLQDYPLPDGSLPSPWARLPWVVYLWTEEDMRRAIEYVEKNPVRQGKPRQRWSFVTPYVA